MLRPVACLCFPLPVDICLLHRFWQLLPFIFGSRTSWHSISGQAHPCSPGRAPGAVLLVNSWHMLRVAHPVVPFDSSCSRYSRVIHHATQFIHCKTIGKIISRIQPVMRSPAHTMGVSFGTRSGTAVVGWLISGREGTVCFLMESLVFQLYVLGTQWALLSPAATVLQVLRHLTDRKSQWAELTGWGLSLGALFFL